MSLHWPFSHLRHGPLLSDPSGAVPVVLGGPGAGDFVLLDAPGLSFHGLLSSLPLFLPFPFPFACLRS